RSACSRWPHTCWRCWTGCTRRAGLSTRRAKPAWPGSTTSISIPSTARRVRRGESAAPDDDVHAQRYELLDARLSASGFDWYEVSNWSRPGGECRHNIGYWDGGQWWGAGPGAHSFVGATRWWNVKHPNA